MMKVTTEKCIGCGQCVRDCFPKDIKIVDDKAIINNVTCMNCGHCIAICPNDAISTDVYNMEDVKEYNKENFTVEADTLLNFIQFRRTIRQFSAKEVEEEKLLKIIEAGRFTQTGSNAQDVSYIVVREKLQELKAMTLGTLKQTGEYMLANLTPETMMYKRYAEMWINMYEEYMENPTTNDRLFFNAPALIIVIANTEINGGLASSNMELMTNALGLGTFFSGFFIRASQTNEKIKELLGVKEGKRIVSCMVIGYPAIKYLRTVPRKAAEVFWK